MLFLEYLIRIQFLVYLNLCVSQVEFILNVLFLPKFVLILMLRIQILNFRTLRYFKILNKNSVLSIVMLV